MGRTCSEHGGDELFIGVVVRIQGDSDTDGKLMLKWMI
jgi:hypothetical protein